jgi:predicted RND superfamily exporter protein
MLGFELPIGIIVALVVAVFFLVNSVKILPEYERGVPDDQDLPADGGPRRAPAGHHYA